MGAFNTKTILYGNPSLIPAIADRICQTFTVEGFEINRDNLMSGGVDISITKGGFFKAIVGMKSALKVTLIPQDNTILFEAGVGVFGQQAIPTVISMLFYWPVLLTQIWGLVKQSKLDDRALAAAQAVINENNCRTFYGNASPQLPETGKFCTNCGTKLSDSARFCSNCGSPLS